MMPQDGSDLHSTVSALEGGRLKGLDVHVNTGNPPVLSRPHPNPPPMGESLRGGRALKPHSTTLGAGGESQPRYRFTVKVGKPKNAEPAKNGTKLSRGANFYCVMSGSPISGDHIKAEGKAGRMGARVHG